MYVVAKGLLPVIEFEHLYFVSEPLFHLLFVYLLSPLPGIGQNLLTHLFLPGFAKWVCAVNTNHGYLFSSKIRSISLLIKSQVSPNDSENDRLPTLSTSDRKLFAI